MGSGSALLEVLCNKYTFTLLYFKALAAKHNGAVRLFICWFVVNKYFCCENI